MNLRELLFRPALKEYAKQSLSATQHPQKIPHKNYKDKDMTFEPNSTTKTSSLMEAPKTI